MDSAPADSDLVERRMSLREWIDLPEDEDGEWVDGWLVGEEVPSIAHERVVIALSEQIGPWVKARGGTVLGSEVKLVLNERRGRKPDLSVWFGPPLPARNSTHVTKPPDLVVEIVTSRARDIRRDRLEKVAEYAAFGVPRYWLVDPEAHTLEVLELREGTYAHAAGASSGRLEVPGCPGLVLDLEALWQDLDRLGPGET